jgi:hypothetical protein
MRLIMLSAVSMLVAAGPAVAEQPSREPQSPARELAEGLDTLMRGLDRLIGEIPLYGIPGLDKNGNIVIPRIERPNPPTPAPSPAPENREAPFPPAPPGSPPGSVEI